MEFSAANVERNVLDFYKSGSGQRNDWLTSAQVSKEAWQFAWELISPTKSPEVQFFGANTLATKVSRYYQELPESDFPMLRDRIIALIQSYAAKGPKIVSRRISVALASLLIHSIPSPWQTPVQDIVSLLQMEVERNGIQVLDIYIELLKIIPEEFNTIIMTGSRKAAVRPVLEGSLPTVFQLTTRVLQDRASIPSEAVIQAVKCLQSWIQFGVPEEVLESLFDQLMGVVQDENLFECALDALSNLVSHPYTLDHPNTMKRIVPKLLSMEPLLSKLLAEESFDLASPLASLFISFGETQSKLLLDWTTESEDGKQQAIRLVSIILRLSSVPVQYPTQETLSEMTFGFWCIFQDDIIACEPQQFQHCVGVFGKAYHGLVDALVKKSMYPLSESGWSADQKESFRCYRIDVADAIMYCHNILKNDLLQLLNSHLEEAISKSQQGGAQGQMMYWPYLEACLYSWSAIAESMAEEEQENAFLVQFLAKLPTIPYGNNVKVISSALDCIGGFAEVLANYPNLVLHLVPLVTSSISNPDLALNATMCLKDMARDCTEALQPSAKDIISACCAALRSSGLKHGECIRLMYPIGKMIALSETKDILPQLEPILMPYLVELQGISAQAQSMQIKARLLFVLKLLTTLFQALELGSKSNKKAAEAQQMSRSEPIFILMQQILPLLKSVAEKWVRDDEVMDAMWLFVKQSVPSLMECAKQLVAEIVSFMSSCFEAHPQVPAIDLARHLVHVSQNDQDLKTVLIPLMARMSSKTQECVRSSTNPSEHSELLATLFQNMAQILKKNTDYFGPQSRVDAAALFSCACFSLTLPEDEAVFQASAFLVAFVKISPDHPYLRQVADASCQMLFRQVMVGIASEKSQEHLERFVDIYFILNKKYPEPFSRWVVEFAKEENFPTPKISTTQKESFANVILKERANKRAMTHLVQELALACLGLKA